MDPPWFARLQGERDLAPTLYAWTPSNIPGNTKFNQSQSNLEVRESDIKDRNRRIYVLGIGNLGVLLATSLAKLPTRPPITLILHRKELLLSWISDPGLEVSRDGAVERDLDFEVEWWTEMPPDFGPERQVTDGLGIQNLIVTTKAPDALPEVDRLRRYLDSSSTIAFSHNGMCKLWPPYGDKYVSMRYSTTDKFMFPNWLACVVTHGVTSRGRFRIDHASQADLKVGPVLLNPSTSEAASYLVDQLTQAPQLSGTEVNRQEVWILQLEKLVVNSIINPLTSILRCKNGYLFDEAGGIIIQVMDLLLEEASGVLQALVEDDLSSEILRNTSITTDQSRQVANARQALLERFSKARLGSMLHDVGQKVRENTSSMLQDVRAGRKTEIMEFNGWLVETATRLDRNLVTTSHQTIIRLVENGTILDGCGLEEYFPAR